MWKHCACWLSTAAGLQSDKETEQERLEDALDQTLEQMAALQVCAERGLKAAEHVAWRLNFIPCMCAPVSRRHSYHKTEVCLTITLLPKTKYLTDMNPMLIVPNTTLNCLSLLSDVLRRSAAASNMPIAQRYHSFCILYRSLISWHHLSTICIRRLLAL